MRQEPGSIRSKIVVALDGSPAAAVALPLARTVAAQLDAAIEVLHVADSRADETVDRSLGEPACLAGTTLREVQGDAVKAILTASQDPATELVVLTTHGRIVEPGRPLGHVAAGVVAGAGRPILLVRPEASLESEAGRSGLRRLLLPLDSTPSTAAALQPITRLAERLTASVDILYVADPCQSAPKELGAIGPPRYVDQPQHEWPQWASEAIDRLARYSAGCPAGVPVQMFLTTGDVGGEVVRFAAEHREDAIALVRRSRLEAGRARHLRTILEQTPCPILLVGGPTD